MEEQFVLSDNRIKDRKQLISLNELILKDTIKIFFSINGLIELVEKSPNYYTMLCSPFPVSLESLFYCGSTA